MCVPFGGSTFNSLISTFSRFCSCYDRYRNLEIRTLGFLRTHRCCRCYPEPTSATCGCKWRVDRKTLGPSFSYRNLNTKGTFYHQITIKLQNLSHRSHVDRPSLTLHATCGDTDTDIYVYLTGQFNHASAFNPIPFLFPRFHCSGEYFILHPS